MAVDAELIASMARIEQKLTDNGEILSDIKIAVFGGEGSWGLKATAQDNAARISAMEKECRRQHGDKGFWGFSRPVVQQVLGYVILSILGLLAALMILHMHVSNGVPTIGP